MNDANGPAPASKSQPFFDRADQIADTGNWDYAIEMYLQGIGRDVENIEHGHEKLREAALRRKAAGGKPAGFMDKLKRKTGKDPLENLVNAEFLMSRNPSDAGAWRQILSAALAGGWVAVVKWAGSVLFEVNRGSPKPSKEIYVILMDSYSKVKLYPEALAACQAAIAIDPKNSTLMDAQRDLSAQATITKGGYDQKGSFVKGVKDLKGQIDLVKKDQISQDRGYLEEQITKARAGYEAEPAVPGKIGALVDALVKLDDESYENEAIDILAKAYRDAGLYRYKVRIGDIKRRQMERRRQKLLKAGDKAAAKEMEKQLLAFELQEFTERAANYPTDLDVKFELGVRQLRSERFDEAIASLQQARREPRRHLQALNSLGQAFFRKGWHTEAAETFEQALQAELTEFWQKEIRYNLGQVYRTMAKPQQAMDQFSTVAQIDYNFRDVRALIEALRTELEGGAPASPSGEADKPQT